MVFKNNLYSIPICWLWTIEINISFTVPELCPFLLYLKAGVSWNLPVKDQLSQFLAHLVRRAIWAIVITLRPSSASYVNFNLLLWNHLTNWNQTWQECLLGDSLSGLFIWFWSEIQHGRQGHKYAFLLAEISKMFLSETTWPMEL